MTQLTNFTMEELLEFSDDKLIMITLGERNPGAYTVISKLFEIIEGNKKNHDMIMKVIKNLMIKNIVGTRLWYIYKNEAKLNINNLLNLDLDNFTDEYFYNKFEKYL